MRKIRTINIYWYIFFAFLFTGCIDEDIEECITEDPASYVRLKYDYNLSFEDLFHHQVSHIDLLLFDEQGLFLVRETITAGNSFFPRGHTLKLEHKYRDISLQLLAWCGIQDDIYVETTMIPGTSRIEDIIVQLNETENDTINSKLGDLFYGYSKRAGSTELCRNDTTTLSLIKNTNTFRIVLQTLEEGESLDVDEFHFQVTALNGAYDRHNNPADEKQWTYCPYFTRNDPEAGAIAELSTLRLLSDRENRLLITHLPSQSTLLDMNLNKYLNALKLQDYEDMPLQEFLDREDEYKIIIFVKKENEMPVPRYMATEVNINNWSIRDWGEKLK